MNRQVIVSIDERGSIGLGFSGPVDVTTALGALETAKLLLWDVKRQDDARKAEERQGAIIPADGPLPRFPDLNGR